MVSAEFKTYIERLTISELFEHQRYIIDTIESKSGVLAKVGSQNSYNDSDDFILAQLENNAPGDIDTKKLLDKNELSSPLKMSQNSHATEVEDSQVDVPSSITLQEQPPFKRKLEIEDIEDLSSKEVAPVTKIDFNTNPITGKPWILEDFSPNREAPTKKRRNRMLEEFNMKIKTESNFLSKDNHLSSDFDNLRNRSPSPPGYGRLDFPTTQERADDKTKSQSIIREKTLYRFLAATNIKLPPYMREYLFKKNELNDIVDNGNFIWSDDKLKLFSR